MQNTQRPSGMPIHKYVPFHDQIRVELRNNDRTPMDPPVYDVINVSVN